MQKKLFKLKSDYSPAGDQPKAISVLLSGMKKGYRDQTLLGVTGSGKTFTMANVIAEVGKPTLVIAHNKTLAAQLAQEYKEFFPENAVHYFVSYYDYYQPEAYMPVSDTYIEKEAMINEEIERLRHASTQALLSRKDVIIVASVSCIYGLGSPEEYEKVNLKLSVNDKFGRMELLQKLVDIHFERTNADLKSGQMRAVGNTVEVMPVSEQFILRFTFSGNEISSISKIDAVTRRIISEEKNIFIFPAKHFITNEAEQKRAFVSIKKELDQQLKKLEKEGKFLEVERLKRRTTYDLAMIREVGYCNGIENYSRHFSGKKAGEASDTLLSYFPKRRRLTQTETQTNADENSNADEWEADFLTIIDESHVTVPQIGGMFAGDQSRKKTLIDYGFRLPSAADNRPLKFDEFIKRTGQTIYTSATPSKYELEHSKVVAQQVIRPTGLLDPIVEVKPIVENKKYKAKPAKAGRPTNSDADQNWYRGQIFDFIEEAKKVIAKKERAIATTLTKKMAEDLSEYLSEKGINSKYLHSDIKTIERIELLSAFRRGEFDCLVGVNLLREGLDLPEVSLIGILDADKEGFLRSETSLVQTIGRAARNSAGRVILYADHITKSMEKAISETARRRTLQEKYNKAHGITPQTIIKKIQDITSHLKSDHKKAIDELLLLDEALLQKNPKKLLDEKEEQMKNAVQELDFETAAILRDEIIEIKEKIKKIMGEKTQLDRKIVGEFDKEFLDEFPEEKKVRKKKGN
jgi:excinuclease ABC subunit B